MGILEGKCQKCGYHSAGWALRFPRNQTCPRCGVGLEITDGTRRIVTGYSPFTADEYQIEQPSKTPAEHDKAKKSHKQERGAL